MTEDDTFRYLTRIEYTELVRLINCKDPDSLSVNCTTKEEVYAWFLSHGWTVAEYIKAANKLR